MIQLVFAYCETHDVHGNLQMAFGLDDGLPWGKISKDLDNFKNATMETSLVMGAKTFSSLPGKLPGRKHIVISSPGRPVPLTKNLKEADQYVSPDRMDYYIKLHPDENFSIIGGAALLQKYREKCDKIVVSRITKHHRVNSTVQLPVDFVMNVQHGMDLKEEHFWVIDELTQLNERTYVRST